MKLTFLPVIQFFMHILSCQIVIENECTVCYISSNSGGSSYSSNSEKGWFLLELATCLGTGARGARDGGSSLQRMKETKMLRQMRQIQVSWLEKRELV